MARQRISRQEVPLPTSADMDARLDPTTDALVRASGSSRGDLVAGLRHTDPSTRSRAVQRLQSGLGNAAVGAMLAGRPAPVAVESGQPMRPAGPPGMSVTIQREDGDLSEEGAQALDTSKAAGGGASETIGPPTPSSYTVTGSSLADVLASISGRDEAGHVGWTATPTYTANTGPTVDTASLNVDITIEMPSWTPPSTMLPKARAEWNRWYGALQAHEQGHVSLVHTVYDGVAKKMIGKSLSAAGTIFRTADASMQPRSDAYDKTTDHGLKTGTVLDVGIETLELAEEQKKKDEAAKAKQKTHEAAVPDAPEDE